MKIFGQLSADFCHTTENSRRGKNENRCEMYKNEKCTCTACKSSVFHCRKYADLWCRYANMLPTLNDVNAVEM